LRIPQPSNPSPNVVCVCGSSYNQHCSAAFWQAFGADKAGSTSIFAHLRTFEHFCAFILLSFSLFLHLSLLLSPFSIFFSYFLLSQSFSLTFSFLNLSLLLSPFSIFLCLSAQDSFTHNLIFNSTVQSPLLLSQYFSICILQRQG